MSVYRVGAPRDRVNTLRLAAIACLVVAMAALVFLRTAVEMGVAPAGDVYLRSASLPLEYLLLTWQLSHTTLLSASLRSTGAASSRLAAYDLASAVCGLALAIWTVKHLRGLGSSTPVSWVYWASLLCTCGAFLSAAHLARFSHLQLARNLMTDWRRILIRRRTLAAVLAIASIWLIAPRTVSIPTSEWGFRRWYLRQPTSALPASWQPTTVTLVGILDLQCRTCRQIAARYAAPIAAATRTYSGEFEFVQIALPRDPHCIDILGPRPVRGAVACDVAAALRMARQMGVDRKLADWLWKNQDDLTPDKVLSTVTSDFGIPLKENYQYMLARAQDDIETARGLGVAAAPAYFLNGRRLPPVSARLLARAIDIEMAEILGPLSRDAASK